MPRQASRAEVVRRRQERDRAQAMSRKVWRGVLVTAGLLLATAVTLTVVCWVPLVRAVRHAQLRTSSRQFLAVTPERAPDLTPYVTGKLVILDKPGRALDGTQERLADDVRAFDSDEVGTIAWVEWDFEPTYNREGRLSGHYCKCKVTVIDRERNLIVGEQTLMGASSPVSSGTRYVPPGQMTANRAEAAVAGYLQGLPRR